MQSCEVGPGQQYALRAREALAKIRAPVEIRWCPAYEGNEIADGWAKIAAEELRTATELTGTRVVDGVAAGEALEAADRKRTGR